MLRGKRILVGVCGSIAAYKTAYLIRQLIQEEAEVKVLMTSAAKSFITPLTLSTLSKNPVLSEFEKDKTGEWNNHVELGLWADLFVIAPASANTLGKMANGICDNLLIATYLSARCPVMVAPAMDLDMFAHQTTKRNLELLSSYGNHVIQPEHGELASGLTGTGRMAEPSTIVEEISNQFKKKAHFTEYFKDKKVLITAGPTYEAIDPVRFIGNHSSGKMGYALAEAVAEMGAQVDMVSGPSSLSVKSGNIRLEKVTGAEEMFRAAKARFEAAQIIILAAAVADYKPAHPSDQKLKKSSDSLTIELVKTTDIAETLGKQKKDQQIMVGFALETTNEKSNAADKLKRKNFDLIVLNSLNDAGAGFSYDTNKITILNRHNEETEYALKSKKEVALDILEAIVNFRK